MGTQSDSIMQYQILDIEKICRTCLKEREMQSIYEKNKYSKEDLTIVSMLTEFNIIQFTNEDELPNQVCMECTKEINKCYLFFKKCKLSDDILRNCCKIYEQDNSTKKVNEENQYLLVEDVEKNNEDVNCLNSDSRTDEKEEIYYDVESQEYEITSEIIVDLTEDSEFEILENEKETQDEELFKEKIEKMNKSISPYKCKKCSISFQTNEELLKHNQTEHPIKLRKSEPCDVCNKLIRCSKMSQHMRTHTHEKPFQCMTCDASFCLNCNLRRHIMACHENIRRFKCEICEHRFTQKVALQAHLRSHSREKLFKCRHCERCFANLSTLNTHVFSRHEKNEYMKTHLSEFKYKCDICQKVYLTDAHLKRHQVFHGEKNFLCSICGRRFINKALLNVHLKVHSGLRQFICEDCGKSFLQLQGLTTHKLVHTGVKSFPCTVCSKSFKQQGHLTYHLRTHSGEKPYTCKFCSKSFALNGNLTVHLRTHTGETPYLCPTCGKGFHDSSSMKKHHRKHMQSKTK